MASNGFDEDARCALRELAARTGAFSRGQFRLSGGGVSDWYFDARRLLNHGQGAFVAGLAIYDAARAAGAEAVGGPALGALPLVSATIVHAEMNGVELTGFYVRESRKDHGAARLIEGIFPEDSSAPVAIVDDVVTSGASILAAIDAAEARGNPIAATICLLDREEGGREALAARGYELKTILSAADVLSLG